MKIVEQNSDRLVIDEEPSLELWIAICTMLVVCLFLVTPFSPLDSWAAFMLLLLSGAVLVYGVARIVWWQARFDRQNQSVLIHRRNLFSRSQESYPLKDLQEVRVDMSPAVEGPPSLLCRTVLVFDEEPGSSKKDVPLSPFFSLGKSKGDIAEEIRSWLRTE